MSRKAIIASEAQPYVGGLLVLSGVVGIYSSWVWTLPIIVSLGLVIYFYRMETRAIPPIPMGVVSPVDGTVDFIADDVIDPYLERAAKVISIEVSPWGEFHLRIPIEGKVLKQWLGSGSKHKKYFNKHTAQPHELEQLDLPSIYAAHIQTDEGDDLVLEISRSSWPRPRCNVFVGERVGHGQRRGLVGIGGHVAVYLPRTSRFEVKKCSQVKSGSQVIGTLLHE